MHGVWGLGGWKVVKKEMISNALPSSAGSETHFLVWCRNSFQLVLKSQILVRKQNLSSFFFMDELIHIITQGHNFPFILATGPLPDVQKNTKTTTVPKTAKHRAAYITYYTISTLLVMEKAGTCNLLYTAIQAPP